MRNHFLVIETVDLAQVWSVAEIQRRIRDYAAAHKEKPWVVGRGWFYGAFPGGLPHRRRLDEAVPDRPAFMTGYDGHTGWANSKALAAAGITRDTPDPEGGVIVKDESGEPTGVLKETAPRLVRRLVPEPSDEDRYQGLRKRLAEAASYGLTSVQNASFQAAELPVYERVLAEGGLSVRVYWAVPFLKDAPAADRARFEALRAQYAGPLVKFGAAKGFIDISAEAALRHFTVDAAYASFEEHRKGTLAAGKLADFVVLSDDILVPPAERLLRTKVLLTVMGGRDTFRAAEF